MVFSLNHDNRARLVKEIVLVLVVTFGASGLRSALRLVVALGDSRPLNEQQAALNVSQSTSVVVDVGLQLVSASVLFGWGFLALFVLANVSYPDVKPMLTRAADDAITAKASWLHGAGLAALIGLPGLVFYATSVGLGLSKEVIPAPVDTSLLQASTLLVWSAANAFAEEIVVVLWLLTRLGQLGWGAPAAIAASAVLRGSYHLYQGVSAGFGNIVMGVVFAVYFHKTRRVWPLVVAHFLIDAVAFVGYRVLGGNLSWLGL